MSWVGAAIAGGASLLGGAFGAAESRKGAKAAERSAQQAYNLINAVDLPDTEKMKLILDQYRQTGEYNPELEKALNLGPTAMEQVSTDPEIAEQQRQFLDQISEVAEGGLTEADQAASREIQRKVAASDTARRKAILSEMAQRGTLGSGAELAAQLQGAQASTDQEAAASDALIQQAMARSLQGITSGASMAGNLRQQEYGEQSDLARARDVINQFNVQNQQQLQSRNVANLNQAQLANLQEQQRIADANIQLANRQQQYNKELLQQKYANEMGKAQALAGQQSAIGQAQQAKHQGYADAIGGVASGIATIGGSFMKAGAPTAKTSSNVVLAKNPNYDYDANPETKWWKD